jgi:hypothetical protein
LQLLGGMGDASHPLGARPADAPISQFWFTNDAARVPLKVRRALWQPRLRLENR